MTGDEPGTAAGQARRITALEELLTHLERTVGELNSVVLDQQSRLAALEQRLARLALDVDTAGAEPPRSLQDDKPPHY